MNFEVHNISMGNEQNKIKNDSFVFLYTNHQKQKEQAKDESSKVPQVKGDASQRFKTRRRSYELPLL